MANQPTNLWRITNEAGTELAVVHAEDYTEARTAAMSIASVAISSYAEEGFNMRRLALAEVSVRKECQGLRTLPEAELECMMLALGSRYSVANGFLRGWAEVELQRRAELAD